VLKKLQVFVSTFLYWTTHQILETLHRQAMHAVAESTCATADEASRRLCHDVVFLSRAYPFRVVWTLAMQNSAVTPSSTAQQ